MSAGREHVARNDDAGITDLSALIDLAIDSLLVGLADATDRDIEAVAHLLAGTNHARF